jgi:pimeloyl-ACP methyl ester carboxylesterase
MATPTLTRHTLAGSLGEILVDVRTSNRSTPGPLVVLIHGFKGFKDWGPFPPFGERLARAGFTVVSYNSSGSGVDNEGLFSLPERFGHNTFSADLADLLRVLEAIHDGSLGTRSPTSIGLVGHSRGGGMAILAAAGDSRVSAIVTWAAIATPERWSAELRRRWREAGFLEVRNQRTGEVLQLFPDVLDDVERQPERLDIASAADRLAIPWLVLHGANDETVPFREAEVLAASAARPELQRIERTGHTFGAVHPFAGMTDSLAQLFDASVAFLSRHLT